MLRRGEDAFGTNLLVLGESLAEERARILLGVGEHKVAQHVLETLGERIDLPLVVVHAVLWVGAHERQPDEASEELGERQPVVLTGVGDGRR